MELLIYKDLELLGCRNFNENLWLSDIQKEVMKKLVKEFNETKSDKNIDNLIIFLEEKKNSEVKLHELVKNEYIVDIWIKALTKKGC